VTGEEKQLTDILIKAGKLDAGQVEQARLYTLQNSCRIAQALIRLSYVTDEDVAVAVSKIHKVPYASLKNNLLDPELGQGLEKLVDFEFARDNLIVPLFVEERQFQVAMVHPTNYLVREAVRVRSGCAVEALVGTEAEIVLTIAKLYQGGQTF